MSVLSSRISPAFVLASFALFFALGGSAFALKGKLFAAQPKCANGAVKGMAYVTGDPAKGIENLPSDYSTAANLFGYRWSCGGAVQVRKSPNIAGADVRFPGVQNHTAVIQSVGKTPAVASVTPQPDGSYQVTFLGSSAPGGYRADIPFMITVF